ncbi:hypothetical protein OJ996_18175 [Luteolibacter sp. GHJ8]|uniref:SGNH/GDSL hydrolase family protein n=1 Tax=Luteolibacter rhizosphaerae TaxID=2989719 RepID=A0ABT3G7H2_9BACT|nr:hypothetical protein [Luteolibacter rhizosphaerae]MCW1915519.1 hypothetical protein [Luteolibacter rhizosphaerae]
MPHLINYQGRMVVNGVNFDGNGQFKFALVNRIGSQTYWTSSADSAPADGVPDTGLTLPVSKGLYSVALGDTALAGMMALPPGVFTNDELFLRVWFNDGTRGWEMLAPDQRIAAVAYAMMAENVPDGAITAAKIAPGAVTGSHIAAGAIAAAGGETQEGAQARVDALGAMIGGGGMNSLKVMLSEGRRTAGIHIISDSTNAGGKWSNPVAAAIGQMFPAYTVKRTDWSPTGAGWTNPAVVQTGTGGGERRWEFPTGADWCPVGFPVDFPMPQGDLDIRAKVRVDDSSASANTFVSKWDSPGKLGFKFSQSSAGNGRRLVLEFATANGTPYYVQSTAGILANGISDGTPYWARVTVDINNGNGGKTFTFFTSTNGNAWVTLGEAVNHGASGVNPLGGNDSNCYLGGGLGTVGLRGAIYTAEIRDGIGGPPVHPLNLDAWAFNQGTVSLQGAPELWVTNAAYSGAGTDAFLLVPPANFCRNYSPQVILISLSHNNVREHGIRFINEMSTLIANVRANFGPIPRIILLTQNPQVPIPTSLDPSMLYESARVAHRVQFMSWASGAGYGVIDIWNAFKKDARPLEVLVGTNTWLYAPITSLTGSGSTVTMNVADMANLSHPDITQVAVIGVKRSDGSPSPINGAYRIQSKSTNASGPGWIKFASTWNESAVLDGASASYCDGVHPSTAGYQLWSEAVLDAFKRGVP